MKFHNLTAALVLLFVTACASMGSGHGPSKSTTCTGTVSDGGAGTLADAPVKLVIDADGRQLMVNDSFTLKLVQGIYAAQTKNVTFETRGDLSVRNSRTWDDRMKRFNMNIRAGEADSGFFIGDGDFQWGGKLSCDNWQSAVPSQNFSTF